MQNRTPKVQLKILVLGGDGFCGWPTSIGLSSRGHSVTIMDNFSRRKIDTDLGTQSLTPIANMAERQAAWHRVSGRKISFYELDIAQNYQGLLEILKAEKPDVIVHFAEQRSAPYSMRSPSEKRYTVSNNLSATHNVLCAIVESGLDIHLVHLGTMGVYGYSADTSIPEGYLDVLVKGISGENIKKAILYPTNPGSIYHLTKSQDQLFFAFYNKNDGVRVTDLHQGIVWGTNTELTLQAPELINRFDYDGEYGTVLNRFLMQSVIGHPLTVNGTGGQTRAFIHIRDTVNCITLAIESPPQQGDRVRILNQVAETHRVIDLANLVSKLTGATIQRLPNPRAEASENELIVSNEQFRKLGLVPITLKEALLDEVFDVAKKYSSRCDHSRIISKSYWNKTQSLLANQAPPK